jgi:hypothetical protein
VRFDNLTLHKDGTVHGQITTTALEDDTVTLNKRADWVHNKITYYYHAATVVLEALA